MQNLQNILQNTFGLENFREGQENIIKSVLAGEDTLVFMPTGGGKSLTYQLPGVLLPGLVLIISPLISLMKDQVDALKSLGLKAELLNSTTDHYDKQIILNDISRNDDTIKFLYIAPERLNNKEFLRVIQNVDIALVAIDEAHCISQWGHDFRPSYMKIKGFLKGLEAVHSGAFGEKKEIKNFASEKEQFSNIHFEKDTDFEKDILSNSPFEKGARGIFPYNPALKEKARKLRNNLTQAEKKLWNNFLRGWEIRVLRQKPLLEYIVDFFIPSLGLIIEIDGDSHFETQKAQEYDNKRTKELEEKGITVLRFTNTEIYENFESVCEKIMEVTEKLKNHPNPLYKRGESKSFSLQKGGERYREGCLGNAKGGAFHIPIIALTATATKKVRKDIIERLGLGNPNIFTKGFDRKNIAIVVREISKKEEKFEKLAEILEKTPGSGIVYCSSRKSVKEVYDFLLVNGIAVGMYTGEMSATDREREQNTFMNGDYKTIVATNAFGMGIDKKDIRFVVHFNLPGSIENYYQEIGRAGRDGKNSFAVTLASFGDTKIQEFFIENSNPSKEEILQFYQYLFAGKKIGEGAGVKILKTYNTMALESNTKNDLLVGAIIRILEKYGILKRGVEDENFRGRGLELLEDKKSEKSIGIDWEHQENLKNEAYFKLEQIKKLLFFPSCRKRFILEYFGDEEDLKNLPENCGTCDFCLEKKKIGEQEDLVKISVFSLVLETVKKYDERFGVGTFVRILAGSQEKKILDWNLDKSDFFGALSDFSSEMIQAIIEGLIMQDFLYKTDGQYPLLGLSETGRVAIVRNYLLSNDNDALQHFIRMKIGTKKIFKREKKATKAKESKEKIDTYLETKKLLSEGKKIQEIAKIRELKPMTIESHILKLYEIGEVPLQEILGLTDFSKLKKVKEVLQLHFLDGVEKLKPIKEKIEELGEKGISYFDIKITLAMLEKKDL